jgi:ubiquinone/menaquinone biosynthesis C-methylase UbiE
MLSGRYGIRTVLCDASREPVALDDASADAVSCFHLIEHMENPTNLLSEIGRILKPGAPAFIVTPDWQKAWRTFWNDPTHKRPYSKVSMARVLRMHGFAVEQHSWNARFGLGRLQAYKLWPRLGMMGIEMLAVARKPPG